MTAALQHAVTAPVTAPGSPVGPCSGCGSAGSWRLLSYACDRCWSAAAAADQQPVDAAADVVAAVGTPSRAASRTSWVPADEDPDGRQRHADQTELADRGVDSSVIRRCPAWAVRRVVEQSVVDDPLCSAAWTAPVASSQQWLVDLEQVVEAVRASRSRRPRAHRHGVTLTPAALRVARALLHVAGRLPRGHLHARASIAWIMRATQLAERTVQYALTALRRAGFLRLRFAGTRVAGRLPGQPVSLTSVHELRRPVTPAELLERTELARHLTSRGEPAPAAASSSTSSPCTPPSSAGLVDQVVTDSPPAGKFLRTTTPSRPAAAASPSWLVPEQNTAAVAADLQHRVTELGRVAPARVRACVRSWVARGWNGRDLAEAVSARPWPQVVRDPVALLRSRLADVDPAAEPPTVRRARAAEANRARQAAAREQHLAERARAAKVDHRSWARVIAATLQAARSARSARMEGRPARHRGVDGTGRGRAAGEGDQGRG